jgi:hypothetical protein
VKLVQPLEAKVTASTGLGALATLVLLLNSWQHWFTPPPPDLTAAIVATVSGVAAYFAPHTPRPAALPTAAVPLAAVNADGPYTDPVAKPAATAPQPEGTTAP